MALLYIDDFENAPVGTWGGNESIANFISEFSATTPNYVSVISGLLSSRCLRLAEIATVSRLTWNNDISDKNLVIGFALHVSNNANGTAVGFSPSGNVNQSVLGFSSSTSSFLRVTSDWGLTLGTLTTPPNVIKEAVYAYIEIEINMNSREFDLYVNNINVGSGTIALTGVIEFYFGQRITSGTTYYRYDDIYILDDTGTTHNHRLGPVRAVRVPFNTTTETNFTPFGAVDNITAINKDNLDASTFNRSPAANDVGDYFKLDTSVLPTDRPIIAVQQTPFYRKTDIGERSLKVVAKDGVSRKEMPLPDRLATFSGGGSQILETAVDGTAWDLTKLANTDFGYEVTA